MIVLAAMLVTQTAVAAGQGPDRRESMRAQLLDLDYEPDAARDAAARLTEQDLEVLLANPGMMQRAGSAWLSIEALIFAGLIIGGIVALAIASDSSSVVVIQNSL